MKNDMRQVIAFLGVWEGWKFGRSVPDGVVEGDEHAAVANRKNVNFVFDDFVNDAIGLDDQLVKAVVVRRYGKVALDGNGRTREGKIAKSVGSFAKLCFPAYAIVGVELGCNAEDDFLKKRLGAWRPFDGVHKAALACFIAKSFSWRRLNTTSLGMPLPSANSRREISMSDSSSAISSRREMGAAMVNGTRRSRAVVTINTLMSDDAESPTSLQKDEKSRLTVSSTEIVILAMVNIPHFACEQCVVYNKYADVAMPCLTKEAA